MNQSPGNQRQSFRCPVADSRRQCVLRVGNDQWPAELLDESTGGFSVLSDRSPDVDVDQPVFLGTDAGWFEVRVLHIQEVPASRDGEEADANRLSPRFRLGLSRLGDALPPETPPVSVFAGSLHNRLGRWSNIQGGVPLFFGVLLALVTVCVPLVFLDASWLSKHWEGTGTSSRITPKATRLSRDPVSKETLPAEDFNNDGFKTSPHRLDEKTFEPSNDGFPGFTSGRGSQAYRSAARSVTTHRLHDTITRLPGATAFSLPEVARELKLTDDQREKIRQFVNATAEAMRRLDLDARLQGQQRQQITQRRGELLDEYRRRAVTLLTPKQRARWEELIAEPPAEKQPSVP